MDLPIDPLALKVLIALAAGLTLSGLAALAAGTNWGWKKFVYTFGLTTISALAIVDAKTQIDEGNIIAIFLEIVGASTLANKLFGIGTKLNGTLDAVKTNFQKLPNPSSQP